MTAFARHEQIEAAHFSAIGAIEGGAVHIHAVVVLPEGTARGGHPLHANVWPSLEVFLTDYPTPLLKELEPTTDLDLFQPEA